MTAASTVQSLIHFKGKYRVVVVCVCVFSVASLVQLMQSACGGGDFCPVKSSVGG